MVCNKCALDKPQEAFPTRGRICKACKVLASQKWTRENAKKAAAYQQRYREENREKYNRRANEWYHAHKDRARAGNLRRKYGLESDEYDALLERQGGGCAICRTNLSHDGGRLSVDHDHKSGKVRGILCAHCNHAVGKFGDSPALLRRAADYLEAKT